MLFLHGEEQMTAEEICLPYDYSNAWAARSRLHSKRAVFLRDALVLSASFETDSVPKGRAPLRGLPSEEREDPK